MSLGNLKSERGEKDTDPIFTPSGMHERLNCDMKNLLKKVSSAFLICAAGVPLNAVLSKNSIFLRVNP